MNISPISIAWALLQIAVLCTLSLIVAWVLRGRRPQLVTAMLAGTCIASLLLAMISVVPRLQWTIALDDSAERSLAKDYDLVSTPTLLDSDIEKIQQSNVQQADSDRSQSANAAHTITASGTNAFGVIRSFLSQTIQRFDREVREAEVWQQPVAEARNFSLLLIAIFGLTIMSLLWCSGWLFMRRLLRCSALVQDNKILSMVASQARDFGLRRTPSVRESMLVPIGATVGWNRVTVLLHSEWREWSPEETSAVIAHELAHAARHDFAWVLIGSWTRILLFFHPMIHVLIHRLRLEQELAADQLAAGKVGNAKAYGRALASLALRSQRSLEISNPRLSSMLAAGHICVTRRILMLKQGSLKPIQSRSRWSIWAVLAIAGSAFPLAGLRGITQEPIAVKKADAESAAPEQPKPLSKEFLAAFPPVEFKGSMIYRPGRFRAGEFGPEAAWFQEWFAISAIGRPIPDRATLYGETIGTLKWTDEERNHGAFFLSAGFREGEQTVPGQLSKLVDPFNWQLRKMRTVSTKPFEGRTIAGVTNSTTSEDPEKWLIDDAQGYFLGSLEQAMQYARGQRNALDSIPANFREDFQNAAFAMVFDDCDQWPSKLEAFYKNSPREADFQVFGFKPPNTLLKDLIQLGVFVDGCKSPACSVRAMMRDDRAAKSFASQLKTLVALGKAAVAAWQEDTAAASKEAAHSFFETLTISESGSQVHIQFDLFIPSLAKSEGLMSETLATAGWINFNSATQCDTIGSVKVRPETTFSSTPSLLGQSLDASEYRGKTVCLDLEIQCNDDAASESGAFIWASRQEHPNRDAYADTRPCQHGSPYVGHRVLSAKTIAANGTSSWSEAIAAERRIQGTQLLPDALTRTLSIAFKVPQDAEHLSFGCYTKNSEVGVKNVRFYVAGESESQTASQQAKDATADIPYNVMLVPGYAIRKSPIELNFEQASSKTVEIAERPQGNQSR